MPNDTTRAMARTDRCDRDLARGRRPSARRETSCQDGSGAAHCPENWADDAEPGEARQVRRVNEIQVGYGVPAVARRVGLDRRFEGIQRQARCPVAVGMDVDVEAGAVGAPDDVGEQVGRQQRVAARVGCVGVGGEERRRSAARRRRRCSASARRRCTSSEWNSRRSAMITGTGSMSGLLW